MPLDPFDEPAPKGQIPIESENKPPPPKWAILVGSLLLLAVTLPFLILLWKVVLGI